MGAKLTNKEIVEREKDRLANCFNYALVSILKENGVAVNDEGLLNKSVKSVFQGTDKMKVSVEISPSLEVSVEKLGKKIVFGPNEYGYEIQQGKAVNAASMGEMLKDVNYALRSDGLKFKYAAGGAAALPSEKAENVAVDYKTYRSRTKIAEHAAVTEARDVLGLDPL